KLCAEILSRPGSVVKTSMSSSAEAVHLQAEETKLEYSRILDFICSIINFSLFLLVGNIVTNSRETPSWREIVSLTVLVKLASLTRGMIHNELSNSAKIDLSKGQSGGGVFDLTGDEDPTDEDGDIRMGDSTGVLVSLGGGISQELNIGDSDNTRDGCTIVGSGICDSLA
nr:hypothetical protein [Tanacetum cinerariifolium]